MSMQRSEKVLLVALIVFVVSFFLPAIWIPHVTPHTATGYWCAYVTLISPWTADGLKDLPTAPVKYFSILLSGWINSLFLISMVLSRRETKRPSRMLRTVCFISHAGLLGRLLHPKRLSLCGLLHLDGSYDCGAPFLVIFSA